jgi:cytochrome c-type biogenesis protein CcmF
MIVEAGHFALALALALSLIQFAVPFWGARRNDAVLMGVADATALGQLLFVGAAFAALAEAHLVSDFSVLNVAENSHSAMPAIYKFSGVWGNHEGSMLLWSLILALFGGLVATTGGALPQRLRADALAIQGLIGAAFLAFILFTSDPFERLNPAPFEGRDLNPILQDPGLAIHPPMLYVGYVGFSIVFSFAAAALIEGRIDAAWARFVRPYTLVAWSFLTLGIAMGSYWAYYTLGWGGFWFWDPVENASLMPWLAGTAFLHSVAVMEKRDALKVWSIFLAILAFSFSLLGTFLVRSGVLTSVHAFASDPRRGVFILMILGFFIAGSLALFAWRAPLLKQGGLFAPISREGALVVNNLFLTSACASVLVGTLYPLGLEQVTGAKISVGAPFFNMSCGVLLLAAAFLTPFGYSLAWKRGDLLGVVQRLAVALAGGVATLVALLAITKGGPVLAPIAAALAVFVMLGAVSEVVSRAFRGGASGPVALNRALGFRLRGDRLDAAGRAGRGRSLSRDLRAVAGPSGAELSGDRRADECFSGRRAGDDARTDAPQFRRAENGDDGSRHRHAVARAALHLDRQSRRRRLVARTRLLEAAGDVDLARRGADGRGRSVVAGGSAPAHRRSC